MAWTPRLTQLNDALADLVPYQEGITKFIRSAGLRPSMVDFHGSALDIWCSVIDEADKQGKVSDLVKTVLEKYPDNPYLKSALSQVEINYSASAEIGKSTQWQPINDDTLEVLTFDNNTLLPINFLEKGILSSRSVAKIEVNKDYEIEVGTGFIFKIEQFDELFFMTNAHVISNKATIPRTRIILNYEEDIDGLTKISKNFKIDSNGIWYVSPIKELDVAIFKLAASDDELSEFGYLSLKKVEVKKNDFVNIIQHPAGQMKQIALYHNIVTSVESRAIQYLTATMGGSSGSPVFNSDWEVVALHHSGGGRKKHEEKLPMGAKSRNEGININSIIDFLVSNHSSNI